MPHDNSPRSNRQTAWQHLFIKLSTIATEEILVQRFSYHTENEGKREWSPSVELLEPFHKAHCWKLGRSGPHEEFWLHE